jgi:putative spermidine/putrescine transport system substrate-binding protein
MNHGRTFRLVAGLAATALLIAACGGNADPLATDTAEEPEPSAADEDDSDSQSANDDVEEPADGDAPDFSDRSMTFVSWGGAYQDAQREAFIDSFVALTGATVDEHSPVDYAQIRAQAEAGEVLWDVVETEANIAFQGCEEGWLEPIDYSIVDPEPLEQGLLSECGLPSMQQAFLIAYNTTLISEDDAPTNWAEFFDTERWPGNRAFWNSVSSGVIEAALLADGVAMDQLYPLDFERALAKLDTIRDSLIFYASGAEQSEMLASGEAALAQAWNGRVYALDQAGEPVKAEWNEHLKSYGTMVVPAGSPNADVAMHFLANALSSQPQADFANAMSYGPANLDSLPLIDPAMAPFLPTSPEVTDLGVVIDYGYWAENLAEHAERFNEWQLGG